jgi:hypothetical protein
MQLSGTAVRDFPLYCHVDKDRPNKTFKSLVHYDFFDENKTDKLRKLTFQETIIESKTLLKEISNKLNYISQKTDSSSKLAHYTDNETCDGFMIDFDFLRDDLIECRTIILPIYKAVGDCGYSKVLNKYADTRGQLIGYMKSLPLREQDPSNIAIFERAAEFDSRLVLPK